MKNPSIPLVSLSYDQERWEPGHEWGEEIFNNNNCIKISVPMELPDFSYAIRIEDSSLSSYFDINSIAIFCRDDIPPLDNIFRVGVKGESPFVGTLLKNESAGMGSRRKTFMTPTPLHIPESKASPIADSLHQTLMFKLLSESQKVRLVPQTNIDWRHPLVFVQK